eukprot:3156194-Pleurochrysis_carterae.AAC.2
MQPRACATSGMRACVRASASSKAHRCWNVRPCAWLYNRTIRTLALLCAQDEGSVRGRGRGADGLMRTRMLHTVSCAPAKVDLESIAASVLMGLRASAVPHSAGKQPCLGGAAAASAHDCASCDDHADTCAR